MAKNNPTDAGIFTTSLSLLSLPYGYTPLSWVSVVWRLARVSLELSRRAEHAFQGSVRPTPRPYARLPALNPDSGTCLAASHEYARDLSNDPQHMDRCVPSS